MRALQGSGLPRDAFDFIWSSCAFEHLGTLQTGLDFVVEAMSLLKPGGIAVHTTEFNVSSNDATVAEGWAVIYRRSDIERLDGQLRLVCCALEPVDFEAGRHRHDLQYDYPPYFQNGRKHIKLLLEGYVSTSVLLIAVKS
jgi:Methyltransferase domain